MLFVFDNLTDVDTALALLPAEGHDILITTRDSAIVGSEAVPFGEEVSLLNTETATTLFVLSLRSWSFEQQKLIKELIDSLLEKSILDLNQLPTEVQSIVDTLKDQLKYTEPWQLVDLISFTQGLPLAIVQAASYLRTYRIPLAQYSEMLKRPNPDARRRFFSHCLAGAQYSESIMTTWDITVEELESSMPLAVRLLTMFGFLDRIKIDMDFLIAASEDYQFWNGRAKLSLEPHVREHFSFLDVSAGVYECSGRLSSLSLVTRENDTTLLHIHPMVHEYALLRISKADAAEWVQKVLLLLLQRLPPLLYTTEDKTAPSDGDAVLVHLDRLEGLAGLYLKECSELSPGCAVFFVEAFLWYRGSNCLDIAERLAARTDKVNQPWVREAVIAARLIDYMAEYQAADGEGFETSKFATE